MYAVIKNENFGYSVATFGDFVAVGNPGLVRYNSDTASITWSGSVDVFKYNYKTDYHDHVGTLYKNNIAYELILTAETGSPTPPPVSGSLISASLHTEPTGSDIYTRNKYIQIDQDLYGTMLEDGYGVSVDIKDKLLVIGCPYFYKKIQSTSSYQSFISGSSVDIFDLEKYEKNIYNTDLNYNIASLIAAGTGSMSSYFRFYVNNAPVGYDIAELLFSTNVAGPYTQVVARDYISQNGGYIEFYIPNSIVTSFPSGFFRFRFIVDTDPFVTNIVNPDEPVTGSFGYSVSINDGWLAVGSPYVSGSEGMVYLYKNDSIDNSYSWSFQQKIVPNDSDKGLLFGSKLELNKVTGSRSGSLIVGIGNYSGSKAFLFEYISGSWTQTYKFTPDLSCSYLTFGDYLPYNEQVSTASRYGSATSIYNNTVVIGAPKYRSTQEYANSTTYNQGAVFVYEICEGVTPLTYQLVLKTLGDETILKNNLLGFSVGIYGDRIIAGSPKSEDLSLCYIQDTLGQLHFCASELEKTLTGQALYLLKNTSSYEWEIAKVYQRKKRYLSPYRLYGYSVDIADKSMVIGAPMIISSDFLSREIDIYTTKSLDTVLDDITGKAYIYNFKNYRNQFHVGNVFYKNGEIILMTSGSIFDGLLFNSVSPYMYEYQINFKGEHTIHEKQIICTVSPGEFNTSTNPSSITRNISTWDINGNGYFDFQDLDILLSYMQYKNTQLYSNTGISLDWSSSIVTTDDEKSLLNFYKESYEIENTNYLITQSIQNFEFQTIEMKDELDLNQDNKLDLNDINILWKYFTNRLTQENYNTYINPSSKRKYFNDIIDHLNIKTEKNALPTIKSDFLDYERLSMYDKTGSYLAPMVTTIGLYSGLDLVAIAKLGSPIKITPTFPINFVVKMDF